MNTAEVIQKKWGVLTRAQTNPLIEELGTSVQRILGNNPNRLGWVITNISDTNCYIALDRQVGADHGILLTSNGGLASMTMDEDFEAVAWEVFGLSGGANKDIFVISIDIVGPLGKEV